MPTPNTPNTGLTVGDILDSLQNYDRDTDIHIEGYVFNRWKSRGEKLLALELTPLKETEDWNQG